ncbi:MAG: sulfur carrier protein ThiS [Hyphomicrobium sp.]
METALSLPHPSTAPLLELRLNGEALTTTAPTLAALLDEQGLGDARIATALNGAFIPARDRAATRLSDGDCVEIVSARQGG